MNILLRKAFILLLFLQSKMLFAGAILHIDRVDLLNGQKIIFFAEQHEGEINDQITAKDVCSRQFKPFHDLFLTFIPRRNQHILYVEANKALRDYNRTLYAQLGIPLTGCESSYLDRFYIKNIHEQKDFEQVSAVKNFDERTKEDWRLLDAEGAFDRYFSWYAEHGFSNTLYEQWKKRFFDSFASVQLTYNRNYTNDFEKRLQALMAQIQSRVVERDMQKITNLVNWRMRNFAAFVNLIDKTQFTNTSLFEFLFEYVRINKGQFYTNLNALLVGQSEPITSMLDLVSFVNIIAELSLLNAILADNHNVILVSCGAEHAEKVIKYFFTDNPRVRSIRSLDMLAPQMLKDLDYASEQVIKFVNQ